jgi:hypothetical protein
MSFEEKLWETAEQLRGKVEVSSNSRKNELDQETRNPKSDNYCKSEKDRLYLLNLKDQYTSKGVFYLKEGNRWKNLTNIVASEPNLAIKIDDMLIDIEKENPPLENVLPKIFSSSNNELIELFDSVKIEKDKEIAKDTFGRIYEFFKVFVCRVKWVVYLELTSTFLKSTGYSEISSLQFGSNSLTLTGSTIAVKENKEYVLIYSLTPEVTPVIKQMLDSFQVIK